MIVKLLTEHHLKGGCRGSSEFTHVKMPHCLKSHALAHLTLRNNLNYHTLHITTRAIALKETMCPLISHSFQGYFYFFFLL